MEQRTEPGADVVTVIAEPGALTFATRREWKELPEDKFDDLECYIVKRVFMVADSVFFLFRNARPFEYSPDPVDSYLLVRIVKGNDGKQVFYSMNLSRAEASNMMRNRLTLWE